MMEFLTENATYVVLACVLVVWLGIAAYVWRVDSRLSELESSSHR